MILLDNVTQKVWIPKFLHQGWSQFFKKILEYRSKNFQISILDIVRESSGVKTIKILKLDINWVKKVL